MNRQRELSQDPRVLEARRLLSEAMDEHRGSMNAVIAPQTSMLSSYQTSLEKMGDLRGGALYYPYLATGMGNGPYVELMDGSVKMDLITGIGVHVLGHMSDHVVEAHWKALLGSTIHQGHLQQNIHSKTLLELMLKASNAHGAHMAHGVISSSGAMANENALKLAFHHRPQATRILAFEKCFHGRTLAMAAITDKAAYRQGLPLALTVDYIPFYNEANPQGSTDRALKKLTTLLTRYPNAHAVMAMELIQGEGGFRTAPKEFFLPILQLLKEHEVSVWVDEVQTLGRTEEIFAYQYLGLDEYVDIVTLGKMAQVCATLFREEYRPKPGLISQTFTSSASAIMAGITVFEKLLDRPWASQTLNMVRTEFEGAMARLKAKHPLVGDLRGRGGMMAFVLGEGNMDQTKLFLNMLFERGVIGFLAGVDPVCVRFLPPWMILERDHIYEFEAIMDDTLTDFSQKSKESSC